MFEEGGAAYVFCEEYPYATGKGVISVFALDDEGNPGPPRVVLERPYHLSYPFVFRHDGAIWMMPGERRKPHARTLPRRSVSVPLDARPRAAERGRDRRRDALRLERRLVAERRRAASRRARAGTACRSIASASPLGPWTPAFDGPALIDASAARPAGRVFEHEGALWRPAQDCRVGYGSGLALCRIDALAPGAFRQTPMRRFASPGGLHTFNMTDRFAAIDAAGPRARASWLGGFDG